MKDPVDRAVRAIARRYPFALLWAQFSVTHLVMLGGMGILRLYQPMSAAHFWLLVALSQVLIGVDNAIAAKLTYKLLRPVRMWLQGRRDEHSTIAAWRALVALPLDLLRRLRSLPLLFLYFPFIAFTTWLLELPWYSFLVLSMVGSAVLAYGLIFRYFAMEITVRPVLERIADKLPSGCTLDAPALPLRWRLLVAGPVINVITGVVVAGLTTHGHHEKLSDLGVAWLIAVGVSFTISLELVVLTVRALGSSLRDMQRATERVSGGDFTARVPVVATDETGRLAESFNSMVGGLQERERLREAFGAYVDPGVAERVLREGSDLTGEEVEVSVLFLDIRDFTRVAEQSQPHEVVALLNGFWDLVVPILHEHGGHANKFIGDGVLAVFGAPARLPDHAACAVGAALEIAERVHDHYDGRIGVGVGVNSGAVVAGTVGGGGRVEFTVIGDTVNTAARVEAATRETGDDVLITEYTRELLPDGRFEFEERPPVPLKGKRTRVNLWAPRMLSTASESRGASTSAVAD
jgi:class 3 adenylate cyclase